MHLVLEARILLGGEQREGPGDGGAERADPCHLGFREIAEHEGVDQRLVARHPFRSFQSGELVENAFAANLMAGQTIGVDLFAELFQTGFIDRNELGFG